MSDGENNEIIIYCPKCENILHRKTIYNENGTTYILRCTCGFIKEVVVKKDEKGENKDFEITSYEKTKLKALSEKINKLCYFCDKRLNKTVFYELDNL